MTQTYSSIEKLDWKETGVTESWDGPVTESWKASWTAESIIGEFIVGFDDGWYAQLEHGLKWEWEPENDCRTYEGPSAAMEACQEHFDAQVESVLVNLVKAA